MALDRNGVVKVIGTDKHNGHVEMQSGSWCVMIVWDVLWSEKEIPKPDNFSHFSFYVGIDESLIPTPIVLSQINNATGSYLMG